MTSLTAPAAGPLRNTYGPSALSTLERKAFAQCERIIEKGLTTFREVGRALCVVRDGSLYRSDYDTFSDYCKGRWHFSDSRARQLISAAKVAETVTNVTLPNEGAARALNAVPIEQRQPTLDWAAEKADGAPLTAKAIREAAAEVADQEPDGDVGSDDVGGLRVASAEEPVEPEPEPGKFRGVGVLRANEAIDALKRIPKNDALRKRGFQIVTDWVKAQVREGAA